MKIKSQLYLVNSASLGSGIARAEATVGSAVREWLRDEVERAEIEFSDVALALHYVVAREAVPHALARCKPGGAKTMKKQYSDLVALCLDHQFDRLIGLGYK